MFPVNFHSQNPDEQNQRQIQNDKNFSSAVKDLVFQFITSLGL